MKTVVIGYGASGSIAALKASEKSDVTILEGNNKSLKKLLITGNAHCNYWNKNIDINKYDTDDKEFLNNLLIRKDEVFNYLKKLGIIPRQIDDYYYPYSYESFSIKTILDNEIKKRNIKVIYDFKVDNIKKDGNKYVIFSGNNKVVADNLIISMGGSSYSKTGSDGSSYKMLTKLNLKVIKQLPSLCKLISNDKCLNAFAGIRVFGKVSLYIDNKYVKEESGQIQFNKDSISGICVFNISNYAIKALDKHQKVSVKINFVPDLDINNILDNDKSISENLESILNYKITDYLLKNNKDIINALTNFEIVIKDYPSIEEGQVTSGGLSLKEVKSNLETSRYQNLFVTGEALDVTGLCGGFNLAFAFISGYVAGESVK